MQPILWHSLGSCVVAISSQHCFNLRRHPTRADICILDNHLIPRETFKDGPAGYWHADLRVCEHVHLKHSNMDQLGTSMLICMYIYATNDMLCPVTTH